MSTEEVEKFLIDRTMVFTCHYVGAVIKWNSPKTAWAVSFYRSDLIKCFITEFYSIEEPTAYDVLSCLQTYEPTFDKYEFFREFGYEPSEENETIHAAVLLEWKKVSDFFTASELEELQEIAQ